MVFLIYDNSSFKYVWSLQINFALLTRVLIVDNFTCISWFDEKRLYWPVWVGFLYTFVIIYLFLFKLMMQSRNGKFPSDAFSVVNSMFSLISFNFCGSGFRARRARDLPFLESLVFLRSLWRTTYCVYWS